MNLDKLQVDARMRGGWQAVDLGLQMARAWFRPLLAAGLLPMLPLAAVLLALFWESPFWALFIVWWLKPFWERLPLFIASRRLFDEDAGVWRSLRGFPLQDALPWLLWRRFSIQRAFDNPVTVLEELRGVPRRARLRVLHGKYSDVALGNQFAWFCFEWLLAIGLVVMLDFFTPESFDAGITDRYGDLTLLGEWVYSLAGIAAIALVMPFHTMAGFALYLNRRIELEAWDIEISFRNLAARKRAEAGATTGVSGVLVSALLALVLAFAVPVDSRAAQSYDRESAAAAIGEVLSGEDFGYQRTVRKWRIKDWSEAREDEQIPEWFIDFLEWLRGFFKDGESGWSTDFSTAASWLKPLLVILFAGLLIYLVRRYRGPLSRLAGARRGEAAPEILFGLDVTPESLPDDVPGQVMALWRDGSQREALSLLYRASLSRLIDRYQLAFRSSHTEAECAALVRARGIDSLSEYFWQLTDVWRRLAYGHRVPGDETVQGLCAGWRAEMDDAKD